MLSCNDNNGNDFYFYAVRIFTLCLVLWTGKKCCTLFSSSYKHEIPWEKNLLIPEIWLSAGKKYRILRIVRWHARLFDGHDDGYGLFFVVTIIYQSFGKKRSIKMSFARFLIRRWKFSCDLNNLYSVKESLWTQPVASSEATLTLWRNLPNMFHMLLTIW